MTVSEPKVTPAAPRRPMLVPCLILLLAAALRLPGLDRPGYSYDECWKAELAAGNGSAHLRLPVDAVFRPVDLYDPQAAAPWWRVWTTMECTHPPLFYLGLRAWTAVVGHGDAAERAFAAVTSVVAVGLLFDAARLLHGRTVAAWAALLMAVAGPQVEQARLASNYALELATVLAAVDAVARVEVLGPHPAAVRGAGRGGAGGRADPLLRRRCPGRAGGVRGRPPAGPAAGRRGAGVGGGGGRVRPVLGAVPVGAAAPVRHRRPGHAVPAGRRAGPRPAGCWRRS